MNSTGTVCSASCRDAALASASPRCLGLKPQVVRGASVATHAWHPRRHYTRFEQPSTDILKTHAPTDREIIQAVSLAQKLPLERMPPKLQRLALRFDAMHAPMYRAVRRGTGCCRGHRGPAPLLPPQTAALLLTHASPHPFPKIATPDMPLLSRLQLGLSTVSGKFVALLAAWIVFGAVHRIFRPARTLRRGRWVQDRSLGGKLIFIEERSPGSLLLDVPTPELSKRGRAPVKPTALPEWWLPDASSTSPTFCPESRLAAIQQQARQLLAHLEQSKLRGQEYSLLDLVVLALFSQESGAELGAQPSTQGARESMFRSGVHAALQACRESDETSAAQPVAAFGGLSARQFVAHLSAALGLSAERAVVLAHQALAATLRALLVDAESAYRRGVPAEGRTAAKGLIRLLRAFPLPKDAPEAELVGGSLREDLAMGHAIMGACLEIDPAVAPYVAVLLGEGNAHDSRSTGVGSVGGKPNYALSARLQMDAIAAQPGDVYTAGRRIIDAKSPPVPPGKPDDA